MRYINVLIFIVMFFVLNIAVFCPLKVYASNMYNVTKISSGLTIDGADTVDENTNYSFTLIKYDPLQELVMGFVDIENAQYTNFNTQELSLTPKVLPTRAGTKSAPKVTLVEDTDSPLMEAGGYKREIGVNYDLIPPGDGLFGLYTSFSSTDFWSSKPTEFSFGF